MGTLDDDLVDGSTVAIDTNALIYFVEDHPAFGPIVDPAFAKIMSRRVVAHASVITLVEVLLLPLRREQKELADKYREILGASIALHGLDADLADAAAILGAKAGLRTPDAIICATALHTGCDFIITNDPDFKRVEGIKALVIKEYV